MLQEEKGNLRSVTMNWGSVKGTTIPATHESYSCPYFVYELSQRGNFYGLGGEKLRDTIHL